MSTDIKGHVDHIVATLECREDGEESTPYEDASGAWDYLDDALDIEYVISSAGEYLGARVLVAFGGPNIWVNTRTNTIDGTWWQDSYSASFTDKMGLDDCLRELHACL